MFPLTHPALRRATHPGFWATLRGHFAQIKQAHAKQARFAALPPDVTRDTGLSLEDVTCEQAYDPALPFFLQSGFGRR